MTARRSDWSVFQRIAVVPHFERVGVVLAFTQGEALNHARRLVGAAGEPIVAHARSGEHEAVDFSLILPPARRSRRYAA